MIRSFVGRTLMTNVVILGVGLFNSILLARWLGPEGRGQIAAALLWPGLLIYLGSIGLFSATLYYIALPQYEAGKVLATAYGMVLLLSIPVVLVGFAAMPVLLTSQTPATVQSARLYLMVIPISMLTQCTVSAIQAKMQIASFNWLRLILPCGYLAGTVALKASDALTLMSVIVLQIALNIIVLILALVVLVRSGTKVRVGIDPDMAWRLIRYGFRIQIGDLSQAANMRLDQVLIVGSMPAIQLGWYVTAASAAGLAQSLSTAVKMIAVPGVASQSGLAEQVNLLCHMFRRYWVSSVIITAFLAITLPLLIPVVFGEEFKPSIPVAEVLLLGALAIGAKEVLAGGAQGLGNPWLGSRAELVAFVVTLILLLGLLPVIGIMGAAIASAAAYCTSLLLVVYNLHRSYAIPVGSLFRIDSSDARWIWAIASGFMAKKGHL